MLDLSAYRRRIDAAPDASLAQLHRAHVCSIPFENLDPRAGVRVSLALDALQHKLVTEARGGYCFEHNLLFKSAIEQQLGATVEPILARVRWGRPPGAALPLTHLLLRVTLGEHAWHADVGFGNLAMLEPIPFGVGGPYEQSGWRYRIVEDDDELVLQTESAGEWRDVYAFLPRPAQLIDIELSNWFTSTHPDSAFVNGLLVTATQRDGTRVILSDFRGELVLSVLTPAGSLETPVGCAELAGVLRERFGLPGVIGSA